MFDRLHLEPLDRRGRRGLLDWSRAAIDTYSLRAKRGGHVGATPVDRGKPGSKLHLLIDALGVPLAAAVTAANVHDSLLFEAMLDKIPPIRTPAGQRRCRPGTLHAGRAYDLPRCLAYLRRRGISARIARRGVES